MTSNAPTTTSTRAFLETLEKAGNRHLVFMLNGNLLVAPGYHVTEIKALSYDAMDCGGQAAQWRETIVQLWVPEAQEESGFMSARKFLSIYRRVASSMRVDSNAEIRFEYGDVSRPAINYHVGSLEPEQDKLLVHLRAPNVTCKARDRRVQSSCCSPAASAVKMIEAVPEPFLSVPSQREERGCC